MAKGKDKIIKTRDGSYTAMEDTATKWVVWHKNLLNSSLGDIIYSEDNGMIWFEPTKRTYSHQAIKAIAYFMGKCFAKPKITPKKPKIKKKLLDESLTPALNQPKREPIFLLRPGKKNPRLPAGIRKN